MPSRLRGGPSEAPRASCHSPDQALPGAEPLLQTTRGPNALTLRPSHTPGAALSPAPHPARKALRSVAPTHLDPPPHPSNPSSPVSSTSPSPRAPWTLSPWALPPAHLAIISHVNSASISKFYLLESRGDILLYLGFPMILCLDQEYVGCSGHDCCGLRWLH